MLILSVFSAAFAGSAAAGTASGINAGDPLYNNSSGDYGSYITVENYSATNSGEIETITVNGSSLNFSSATASVSDGNASVNTTTVNADGDFVIEVVTDGSIDGDLRLTYSGVAVNSAGTGDVSATIDGATYTSSFSYARQGTIALSTVSTTDGSTAPSTVDVTVYNDSGSEVLSESGIDPANWTITAETGNYSVDVTAGGFDTYSEDISVSGESTTSVSPSLTAQETATGTIEVGEVTGPQGNAVENYSVDVIADDGSIVASTDSANGSYTATVETGAYDVEVSSDFYQPKTQSVDVTENTTSTVNYSLVKATVNYDFTVEDNGSAVDSFNFSVYDGATIEDGEESIASGSVGENESNTISVDGLTHGQTYSLEITYTDADGNEQSYTTSFTADASGDGPVSETVDVHEESSESDSSDGFLGGVGDFNSPLGGISDAIDGVTDQIPDEPVAIVALVLSGIGGLFVVFWVLIGLRVNSPF